MPSKIGQWRIWFPVSQSLMTTMMKWSNVFKSSDLCTLHCRSSSIERWYKQGNPFTSQSCHPAPKSSQINQPWAIRIIYIHAYNVPLGEKVRQIKPPCSNGSIIVKNSSCPWLSIFWISVHRLLVGCWRRKNTILLEGQSINCMPIPRYCRLGFECEILLIASFYIRRNQKNHRKKNTQWILHVTTPLLLKWVLVITNIDFTYVRSTCMHVRTAVDRWKMSLLRFFKPTINLPTPSQVQLSLE